MTPEELLTLGSKAALYRMFQEYLDENYPGIQSVWYRAAAPVVVDGTLTSVLFSLDRMVTPVENWNAITEFTIQYHRIALSDIVTVEDPIPASLPVSHYTLVRAYLDRFGVGLDLNDIQPGSINTHGDVVVVSEVNSYRWIGQASISTVSDHRSLNDIAQHNRIVTNFSEAYSSAQVKRDLITHLNAQNRGRGLPDITFEDVQICCPVTEGMINDNTNTRIKVRSISGLYQGEVDLYYRRRHFTHTWRKPIEIRWDGWSDIHSTLPVISDRLGCQIVTSDVINTTVTTPEYKSPTEVIVSFQPESVGYLGELKVLFHV